MAVKVQALDSGLSLVSLNDTEQFTAASTYKVFVANSIIEEVDAGRWQWSDPLLDTTLSTCFDLMIVESDNDCPNEWLAETGWDSLESSVEKFDLENTQFVPGDLMTTASDLSKTLVALNDADSMSKESRSRLFGDMETQEFRDGIPAALDEKGKVADKVGFLEIELHDAAIIRTPKGDYTMVILTTDLTWEAIEEIAEEIYEYL